MRLLEAVEHFAHVFASFERTWDDASWLKRVAPARYGTALVELERVQVDTVELTEQEGEGVPTPATGPDSSAAGSAERSPAVTGGTAAGGD